MDDLLKAQIIDRCKRMEITLDDLVLCLYLTEIQELIKDSVKWIKTIKKLIGENNEIPNSNG